MSDIESNGLAALMCRLSIWCHKCLGMDNKMEVQVRITDHRVTAQATCSRCGEVKDLKTRKRALLDGLPTIKTDKDHCSCPSCGDGFMVN